MGLKKLVSDLTQGLKAYPNHNNPSTSGGFNYGSSTSVFDTGIFQQRSLRYDINNEHHTNPSPLMDQNLPRVNETPREMGDGILDGFTRGGILVAGKRAIQDTARIGKFLLTGNGLRFVTTQIGLQKMNPRIQEGDPGGIGGFLGNLGEQYFNTDFGLKAINRTYNPLNTLAQIPVNFSGIHLNRAGVDPTIPEEATYINLHGEGKKFDGDIAGTFDSRKGLVGGNRLLGLAKTHLNLDTEGFEPQTEEFDGLFDLGGLFNNISDFINNTGPQISDFLGFTNSQTLAAPLYEYNGGPMSSAGLGKTTIKRYEITSGDLDTRGNPLTFSGIIQQNSYNNLNLPNFDRYRYYLYEDQNMGDRNPLTGINSSITPTGIFKTRLPEPGKLTSGYIESFTQEVDPNNRVSATTPTDYIQITDEGFGRAEGQIKDPHLLEYKSGLENEDHIDNVSTPRYTDSQILDDPNVSGYITNIFSTKDKTETKTYHIASRVGIGEPGRDFTGKKSNNYSVAVGDNTWRSDALNLLDIQENEAIGGLDLAAARDLIRFRFELVDTDNPDQADYLFFRAFLDSFGDSFKSSWDSVKYSGRGEDLFTYKGFSRDIGLSFKIAAQSSAEMKPLYRKLNYLASTTAPDYGDGGRIRGNYIRLTVGDYLNSQPGFITNIGIKWNKEYPWEIAISKPEDGASSQPMILPHVLDVDLSFTPIHDFLPRKSKSAPFIISNRHGWLSGDSSNQSDSDSDLSNLRNTRATNNGTKPSSTAQTDTTFDRKYDYAKDTTPVEGASVSVNGVAYYYKEKPNGEWKQYGVGTTGEKAIRTKVFND